MSVIRRRWHFTGNVQGVGFRYFAQCAAQKLGLTAASPWKPRANVPRWMNWCR